MRLLPHQPIFFDYFKRLNACVLEISDLLNELSNNFKDFEEYFKKAREIEHKADAITREITHQLNISFITPFERGDINILTQEMDEIIDLIERTFKNIYLYEINQKRTVLDEFCKIISEASKELEKLVCECFEKQKHTPVIDKQIIKIHKLEDAGDSMFRKEIRKLLSEEKDPVLIIKWKDIIEDLEEIMDQFRKASGRIQTIMVKSS